MSAQLIVALDADTTENTSGTTRRTPGDNWDFDASDRHAAHDSQDCRQSPSRAAERFEERIFYVASTAKAESSFQPSRSPR